MEDRVLCAKITVLYLLVKKNKQQNQQAFHLIKDNRIIIINLFLTSLLFSMNCRLVTPALFREA